MSKSSMLLIAVVIGIAITACQISIAEAGSLSEKEVAAIKSVTEPYTTAMIANDWAAVAAFYTEDAVRMPPNELLQTGRAAIQADLESLPGKVTDFSLKVMEVDGHEGMAYVRGSFSITHLMEGVPDPVSDTGKWLNISRKQADGSWLIAISIWNSDEPLPGMAPESNK